MAENFFIVYGLVDPRTGFLRYVGKSSRGTKRSVAHWRDSRLLNSRDKCHSWIKSVLKDGFEPEVEILEVLNDPESLNEAEIFWIGYAKFLGCTLTNMTGGGDGQTHMTLETRKKISEKRKGVATWKNGGKHSEQSRKKMSDSHRNVKLSNEHRARISQGMKGHSAWSRGKTLGEETKKKMALSHRLFWKKKREQS